MWVVKQKPTGEFYLAYDRTARRQSGERGVWEFIGFQNSPNIEHVRRVNESNGILCCNDNEGGVRALILGD